jgi:hypothetical protein
VCDGTGSVEESSWLGRRDGKKCVIGLGEKEKSLIGQEEKEVSLPDASGRKGGERVTGQGQKEESV